MMSFEILKSETVYQGKAFDVRRDLIRLPNGNQTWLDIVDHPAAVTIVPIDPGGRVSFVRQYRHSAGGEILELPAGTVDDGEEPDACALREVREEIGMSASRLELIGQFFLAPGYSTEYMYIYLATGLHPDPLPGDEDEFISVESLPYDRALELIAEGQIRDAKTLAALCLAQPYLGAIQG
jgi:ADP-ribose pyrophosphatase